MSADLVIRFPTKAHLKNFRGWLSDGGGEGMAMDASEIQDEGNPIVAFQYHEENPKFKRNQQQRYTPFKEGDNLIIAHDKASYEKLIEEV